MNAPSAGLVVVAAAILRDDDEGMRRVLAAQRTAPAELADLWECPGGKVEPGETDEAALVRECREELGVDIVVGGRIGPDIDIGGCAVLRTFLARSPTGEPRAIEHAALRWLSADQLGDVPWLPTDASLVVELAVLLGRHPQQ